MTAVIIDDEEATHNNLKQLLTQQHPEIQLLGSAFNVATGVELIRSTAPEVLFLDVELTDGTGFDLLTQIEADQFIIIFVSSYHKYAIRAFDFAAMAYLSKPTSTEKLKEALERAQLRFQQMNRLQRLEDLLDVQKTVEQEQLPTRLTVSNSEGFHLIELAQIEWVGVQDSLVEIHETSNTTTYVSGNLITYARKLKPFPQFYRLSTKSPIVNLEAITCIQGDEIVFRSGKRVSVPKGKGGDLRGRLGGV